MDPNRYPYIWSLSRQGLERLVQPPASFWEWACEVTRHLSPSEWFLLLLNMSNLSVEEFPRLDLDRLSLEDHHQATVLALKHLLSCQDETDVSQLFYRLSDRENLGKEFWIRVEEIKDILIGSAHKKELSGKIIPAILDREYVFHLYPSLENNILNLVRLNLAVNEIETAEVYLSLYVEEIRIGSGDIELSSNRFLEDLSTISQIFEQGFWDFAATAWRSLIGKMNQKHRSSLEAWINVISDSLAAQDHLIQFTEAANILDINVIEIVDLFFRNSNRCGYLLMARALGALSEFIYRETCPVNDLTYPVSYLMAAVNSAYYFSLSARSIEARNVIYSLASRISINDLISSDNQHLPVPLKKYTTDLVLFVYCFCLFYFTDDPAVIYGYQIPAANQYSQYVKQLYPGLAYENSSMLMSARGDSFLRVGYLSNSFRRHSVGYLSRQIIENHRDEKVHVYCYQYETSVSPQDEIYRSVQENVYCFRDLSSSAFGEVVNVIRQDQLDILVYMDSLTSTLGCQMIALRLAPIQMSWLGGDTPGLPEIDYVLVDQHLFTDQAYRYWGEKLIPLTVFTAVEGLAADPVNPKRFRQQIGATDDMVVFWSAAIAHKRSMECIRSHIEILSQVPNSLLVVKGAGDQSSVRDQYEAVAENLGVNQRLRFVAMSPRNELHRAQLGAADLILDTFPYTGSTHTVEALSAGVPVLTKVGQHYYGRMSYSLLRSVGLDSCITHSISDYVDRGVQLGLDSDLLQEAKRCIQRTRSVSPLWDPQGLAREMESVYLGLV